MPTLFIKQKRFLQKFAKFTTAAIVGSVVLLPALPAEAAGASIYLTANRSTLSAGSTLVIAVYMNGGGNPINAVEADLNYPASKLQYVGLNYSGGAFSISTPGDGGGNGSVSIQNGTTNPISGTGLIATVTFRALSSSGSAFIGVSGSSNLISSSTNAPVPFSASGITVKLGGSSAPAASSGAKTHTSGGAAPAAAAAPPPPKDTSPPVISGLKIKNLTPFSATVTWTTNEPSSSEVDYGLDASYGLSNAATALTTSHAVALDSTFLTPETVFHYHVKSADAAGNVGVSPDQHFSLPGVPVTIVVLGANGKPEAGAMVTLDGATSTTDEKGQVTLPSSLGNKKITTTFQGVTIQKPITVAHSSKPLPPYQLDLTRQPLNSWALTSIGLFVVVLVLLGIDAVLFGSHFFVRLAGLRLAPAALLARVHHGPPVAEPPKAPATPAPTEVAAEQVSTPDTTPVTSGFNIKTIGETPTPPTLKAIDNIQPLSNLRRNTAPALDQPAPTPPSEPAAASPTPATRIAVNQISSEDTAAADNPAPKAKPKTVRKHRTAKPKKKPESETTSA